MLFSLHTRLRVHWAPGIPCALCLLGERFLHNSGETRRGIAKTYHEDERAAFSAVIAREAGRPQDPFWFADEHGRRTYPAASIHSAAPRHSVSRCSGRKNPKWPILLAPVPFGVTVMISGLIAVNPEHSN